MIYVTVLIAMALMRFLLPRDTLRSRRVFAGVSFFLLTFIAACRAPEVGRDTALFLDVFQKLHGRGFLDTLVFSSWVEPGFRLLCFLISRFTANGQWLIAITALLINGSVSLFIYRHAKNIYLAFYLYLAMMLYPFYLNTSNQDNLRHFFYFSKQCRTIVIKLYHIYHKNQEQFALLKRNV